MKKVDIKTEMDKVDVELEQKIEQIRNGILEKLTKVIDERAHEIKDWDLNTRLKYGYQYLLTGELPEELKEEGNLDDTNQ